MVRSHQALEVPLMVFDYVIVLVRIVTDPHTTGRSNNDHHQPCHHEGHEKTPSTPRLDVRRTTTIFGCRIAFPPIFPISQASQ